MREGASGQRPVAAAADAAAWLVIVLKLNPRVTIRLLIVAVVSEAIEKIR